MHFLVAGAGAIGGYLETRLAQKGENVTPFECGPHLKRRCRSVGCTEIWVKILGNVLELGDRPGVAVPHTRTVYACTKLMDELSRKETKR